MSPLEAATPANYHRQLPTRAGRSDALLGMSAHADTCRSSPFEQAVKARLIGDIQDDRTLCQKPLLVHFQRRK